MKGAFLALLLAGSASAEDYALPPPPALGSHVDYWADKAEFDGEKSTLHLSGDVTLKESTMTIKGQDLWIDISSRTGRSVQPFFLEDGASAVYGESGEFDLTKHTSHLLRSLTGVGDWRIKAGEAQLYPDRRMEYRTANFTSCDHVPPDYHFQASSVLVMPKKYILGHNTVFYLGSVPVFYTPIFYKSLDPTPMLRWRFQPGYERRVGHYLKGTLTTSHTPTTYSKIFDDYYTNNGFGFGAEVNHHAGENSRGSLHGYRIHENGTVNNRWGAFGGGYKDLGASYSFQGRLQFQSDSRFTNDYIRSDIFRLTPELINSAALTKNFSRGAVRVIYARGDVQHPQDPNKFIKDTESLPRVEAQSNSFRLWKLPWLNSLSAFAEDNYNRGRVYRQRPVNVAWTATNSFPMARGVSFTPNLNYSETYYNRADTADDQPATTHQNLNSFIGRWTAFQTLRFNTLFGALDATHTYGKRLKPNEFTEDTAPADRGVEQNQLTLTDFFIPVPRIWARLSSGFDFRTPRNQVIRYRDRVLPIALDLSWQSSQSLIATLHNDYKLGEGNRSVIGDVRWGDDQGVSVGAGVFYNLSSPGTYYQSLDFTIAPSSPTWHIKVALRTLVLSPGGFARARKMRLFEKEITWTRRWHDFYTQLVARIRPGGLGEITGRVEFKFGSSDPREARRRDWEAEWFPGRAKEADAMR